MNKIKGNSGNSKSNPFVKALELELFSKKDVQKWLPFVLYCTFLAFLYISNRIYAEKRVRELEKLEAEIKDVRADYLTVKSDLMNKTQQSAIAAKAKKIGLKELSKPPHVIVKKKSE